MSKPETKQMCLKCGGKNSWTKQKASKISSVNSVDYSGKDTVHAWDIRWGVGEQDRKLDERTAGLLVPYMLYTLLPSTVDAESAKDLDVVFGIEVSGEWGGK